MSEEYPNPDQERPSGEPAPTGDDGNPQVPPRDNRPESSTSDVPAQPPAPPSSWQPTYPEQGSTSSPEQDADLREQRARRYGGPAEPDSGAPGGPASSSDPFGGPPTEAAAAADPTVVGEPEAVTPIPAAPPAPPVGQGGAPGGGGPAAPYAPAQQGPFQATTQMPTHQYPAQGAPPQPEGFEGFEEAPASRAAAHWWTILITLVFAPVAWYLFADGGARMEWAITHSDPIPVAVYIEFGFGLLAVFILLLAARWSSLGAIIMGSLFFLAGVLYLIFPAAGTDFLVDSLGQLSRLGQFGVNVVQHLTTTLQFGQMALYGVVLIMVGIVSHGARRQGRREERTKIALGN